MAWDKSTFPQDDKTPLSVEDKIPYLHVTYLDIGFNHEVLQKMNSLEKYKTRLIAWKEAKCRMKSSAIWISKGDNNTNLFQQHA
jgi:hypothetical protein